MARQHTPEDRYKAAAALVASGNSIAAGKQVGLPASTIRHWAQHDIDFQAMCQEVRTEFGETIKSKLAQIINAANDQTLDRLQNGDVIRDSRTGELVRIPIKGKDAAIIGAVSFDKLRLAESQPTSIVQHENTTEKLQRLADQFRTISQRSEEADKEPR